MEGPLQAPEGGEGLPVADVHPEAQAQGRLVQDTQGPRSLSTARAYAPLRAALRANPPT